MPYLKKKSQPFLQAKYIQKYKNSIQKTHKTVGSYLNDLSDVLPFGTAVNFGVNVLKSHFDKFLDP